MDAATGKSGVKYWFCFITAILLIVTSCDKKIDTIRKSDIESLPTQTVKDFTTTYTDSATKQLVMSSPLMERYTNRKDPFTEFRFGIKVIFYDGKKDPVGTLSSRYARYAEDKKLWELKDSVIAVNERKEVMETELLYWDQEKELVYTDRFVRMTSEDQIVMGTGFQSDPRFMDWHIRNVSASFYIEDDPKK
jgi:LPS export ABC transporter protein LptC